MENSEKKEGDNFLIFRIKESTVKKIMTFVRKLYFIVLGFVLPLSYLWKNEFLINFSITFSLIASFSIISYTTSEFKKI